MHRRRVQCSERAFRSNCCVGLLRPKPALWGRVQAFKRAFFSDTLTIGVQMRRTERWTYSWHEPTFFEAAEAMIPPGVDPASVRFFIATENATSRVNAIQALGPDRVIFNPAVLRTQGMRGTAWCNGGGVTGVCLCISVIARNTGRGC